MGGIDGWGIGGPPTSEDYRRWDQEKKVHMARIEGMTAALNAVVLTRKGHPKGSEARRALDSAARRIRAEIRKHGGP